MTKTMRPAVVSALCALTMFCMGVARADITLERSMSVEGVGAMAFGNMSGTTRTTIAGTKARTDTDIKMQSKIVSFLARSAVGPSAEIVLLDDDKMYHLNMNKKEYSETTFEQMRAQLQKATDQMNSDKAKQQPSAVDQSKCDWLPPKAEVKKTGEKAQYAGYDSERLVITASQPCKDKETGAICEVALVLDEWMSTSFSEGAEAQRYYKAYATKMGLDPTGSQDISQRAQTMFSQYKGIWAEVATKMQNVKGYPVRSSFTLALGGSQCKDTSGKQAEEKPQQDSSDNNPAGLAGAVAGKLGGLFHKKKDDSEPAPAAAATPAAAPVVLPPGDVALMTVSSQLVSVSNGAAGAEAFSVPANFKKVEPRS